ncbi:MAG: hypothetical protein ACRCX2_34905 [Paraclostridium sp.]
MVRRIADFKFETLQEIHWLNMKVTESIENGTFGNGVIKLCFQALRDRRSSNKIEARRLDECGEIYYNLGKSDRILDEHTDLLYFLEDVIFN